MSEYGGSERRQQNGRQHIRVKWSPILTWARLGLGQKLGICMEKEGAN
jgi:hypothetical protein